MLGLKACATAWWTPLLNVTLPAQPGSLPQACPWVTLSMLLCVLFEPGLQPLGGWHTQGRGRMPGVHCAFRQSSACAFPACPHKGAQTESQPRAIYSCGHGEGRQPLFLLGNSPACKVVPGSLGWHLANLAPKEL